jgi:hypothetical protein
MHLAARHFRHEDVEQRPRRACSSPPKLGEQGERVTTCPDACAGTASPAVGGRPAHPTLDGPTVIAMSCAAGSTWPLPFQDALIAVAVTFVLAAGRDGLRDQSSGSRLMSGCRWTASTLTGEHWRWSDTCGSGRGRSVERERLTGRQESVSLRHPWSEATWENGSQHSGSPGFADTEEVTGSNPVPPTTPALTRAFIG